MLVIGTNHNPVALSHLPRRTSTGLAFSMSTCFLSEVTFHPLSARTGTDSRGFFVSRKTLALGASAGRVGMSRVIIPTDLMLSLFVQRTSMGLCASFVPTHPGGAKFPVACWNNDSNELFTIVSLTRIWC